MVNNGYMKIDKKAYGFNRGIVDMFMYNRLDSEKYIEAQKGV